MKYVPIQLDRHVLTAKFFLALVKIEELKVPEVPEYLLSQFFREHCRLRLEFDEDGFSWKKADSTTRIGNVLTADSELHEFDREWWGIYRDFDSYTLVGTGLVWRVKGYEAEKYWSSDWEAFEFTWRDAPYQELINQHISYLMPRIMHDRTEILERVRNAQVKPRK